MGIGLAHGYGLSGSGSNLWTRSIVRALCAVGREVHLLCQESRPEAFDFVARAVRWDADGGTETLFEREVPYEGRCVVHRPVLEVLPTYVRPQARSDYVFSILDLDEARLEEYLERNRRVIERLAGDEWDVRAWHVNHVLLLSEAFRRAKASQGVAYGVMPHGSAIEYVVRRSDAMRHVAARAVDAADRLFALNQEVRDRMREVFPQLELEARTVTVRAGVDTHQFRLVPRAERGDAAARVAEAIRGVERGREPERGHRLAETVRSWPGGAAGVSGEARQRFGEARSRAADYARNRPDQDLETSLGRIDWGSDPVVLYVGRLIGAKGVGTLLAAFPDVLVRRPDARLVVVGAGPLREVLEAFVAALGAGRPELSRRILDWGEDAEEEGVAGLEAARRHVDRALSGEGADAWIDAARALPDRVHFTGFLEHDVLCHLFPLADAAVFPSVVAEASPLVVAEAAASGAFPIGTDFAGMGHALRALGSGLEPEVRDWMGVSPDPARTGADIAAALDRVLVEPAAHAETLRTVAEARFDWRGIASNLAGELDQLSERAAVRAGR